MFATTHAFGGRRYASRPDLFCSFHGPRPHSTSNKPRRSPSLDSAWAEILRTHQFLIPEAFFRGKPLAGGRGNETGRPARFP